MVDVEKCLRARIVDRGRSSGWSTTSERCSKRVLIIDYSYRVTSSRSFCQTASAPPLICSTLRHIVIMCSGVVKAWRMKCIINCRSMGDLETTPHAGK